MELGTAASGFHVTRLTEASFIVSTPTRAGTLADASVDPAEACKLSWPAPREQVHGPCVNTMAAGIQRDGLRIGGGQELTLIDRLPDTMLAFTIFALSIAC
jgi:hypothetical protein